METDIVSPEMNAEKTLEFKRNSKLEALRHANKPTYAIVGNDPKIEQSLLDNAEQIYQWLIKGLI